MSIKLLSIAEKQIIDDMIGRGLTTGQVAKRLNRPSGTVWHYCALNGLREVKRVRRAGVYMRGARLIQPFSAAEDSFIVSQRQAGCSLAAITRLVSEKFGTARATNSVRYRLIMLAAAEDAA